MSGDTTTTVDVTGPDELVFDVACAYLSEGCCPACFQPMPARSTEFSEYAVCPPCGYGWKLRKVGEQAEVERVPAAEAVNWGALARG